MSWVLVAAIGVLVGLAELVTRYRDSPSSVLRLFSAWIYLAINGATSVLALMLINIFGWTFGGTTDTEIATWRVLVAGFSALVFLRSSIFTVRIGDTDVNVGPSAMLTALLGAADRGIDRVRAAARLKVARSTMAAVDFDTSMEALVTNVTSALQNLPKEEATKLAVSAGALKGLDATGRQKSIALGLILLNAAGPDLLKEAVASLDQD